MNLLHRKYILQFLCITHYTSQTEPFLMYSDDRSNAYFWLILFGSFLQYPAELKLEIIEFAKAFGQRKTSRLFQISQKRIFEWLGQQNLLQKKVKATQGCSSTQGATCSHGNRSTEQNPKNHVTNRGHSSAVPTISSKSTSQVKNLDVETEIYHWAQAEVPKPNSTQIRKKAVEMYRCDQPIQV